eukprot:SAG11_NODE_528_length_8722_cov_5.291198_4_plen_97_part_00
MSSKPSPKKLRQSDVVDKVVKVMKEYKMSQVLPRFRFNRVIPLFKPHRRPSCRSKLDKSRGCRKLSFHSGWQGTSRVLSHNVLASPSICIISETGM